jgi:beta-lactamase regulating signal transducer with metallopeptidase domain
MASLMSYCALVALLVSLLGLAVEQFLSTRDLPRRFVWALALAASLAYPAIGILLPIEVPPSPASSAVATTPLTKEDQSAASSFNGGIAAPAVDPVRPAAQVAQARRQIAWPDFAGWNQTLKWLWTTSICVALTVYLFAWLRLRRMSRRWMTERVNDRSVRIADDLGPAVVGFIKPQIVLPRWLLGAPPDQRGMALEHEILHIAARDPLLLHVALLLCACAPWNLLLWWQLRRLRFAIEVDCDRRVLKRGSKAKDYGEMLLYVKQRQLRPTSGVLALTERASQLERRIRIITRAGRRPLLGFIGLLAASVSVGIAAQQFRAPNILLALDLQKDFPEITGAAVRQAREISRSRFPELFSQTIDGTAVVVVVFNNDGSVFSVDKKQGSSQELPEMLDHWAKTIPLGAEPEDIAYVQITDAPRGAWSGSRNPYRIVLVTKVLHWPIDPTRSVSRVRQAVKDHFPDLDQAPAESLSLITVLMNEDGTVNRGTKNVLLPPWVLTAGYERYSDPTVSEEQIGRSGFTQSFGHSGESTQWMIRYAWPRRANDPTVPPDEAGASSGHWWWTKNDIAAFLASNADAAQKRTPQDDAIIARYFPDALVKGLPDGRGAWLLLGRDGRILVAGTSIFGGAWSSLFLDKELSARYPGLSAHPCEQIPPRRVMSSGGRNFRLLYECVAIDSSLTQITGVEPSKDTDLFIYGYVYTDRPTGIGKEKAHYPYSWIGQFGRPAPSAFLPALEVVATDAGAREVELKVRQRTLWEAPWSEWTTSLRVKYGEETDIEVPGQNGAPIKIDLRPIRLSPTERFAGAN